MNRSTLTGRWWLAVGALGAVFSGCSTETAPRYTPAMPQVTGAPVRVVVSEAEALARAQGQVRSGDFKGAVASVELLPEDRREAVFQQLVGEVAARDAARAASLALVIPEGVTQDGAVAQVSRALLAKDRADGVRWTLEVPSARARLVAMDTVAGELTANDPAAGLAWIEAMPERAGRSALLQLAAARWARRDPEAALNWAASRTGDERARLTTSVAFEIAQTTPERAAQVAGSLPQGRDRLLLISAIAQTWIARDPKAAMNWTQSLANGPVRDAALAGIAAATSPVHSRRRTTDQIPYRYGARLPVGGSTVVDLNDLASLSPGLERMDAVQREFERRLRESPAQTATWLSTLASFDVNEQMQLKLAREWFRIDPAAAGNWIDTTIPSPTRREAIWQELRATEPERFGRNVQLAHPH